LTGHFVLFTLNFSYCGLNADSFAATNQKTLIHAITKAIRAIAVIAGGRRRAGAD
jgi:hypothetical protein